MADERERIASERDRLADERDRLADERDECEWPMREQTPDERDLTERHLTEEKSLD